MGENDVVREGLLRFAEAVTVKTASVARGAPEDQLRSPFEEFLRVLGTAWGWTVTCTGEATLPDRLGRPDYAVSRNKLLTGHVELKKPGTGAVSSRFSGHDEEQFKRFSNLPNILYTDGNEWALYRSGKRIRTLVRLAGAVDVDGRMAVGPGDGARLEPLLRDFLEWQPIPPLTAGGSVDLRGFAELLAPLCRMLRNDVAEALSRPESPIHAAARDWRYLLFPEASDEQFADAYAQTVAFALLLGRSLGADPLNLHRAQASLAVGHSLMSRALAFLTDDQVREEIDAGLDLLLRVIGVVPSATLSGTTDPWLHFYEVFLAKYDPKLRKKVGVYYTPIEVVRAQVRLVDDLLTHQLGQPFGFASRDVITLDPAVGTGTYLLGVIEHALGRVEEEQGLGAVAGQASSLAKRLYGFEVMVGHTQFPNSGPAGRSGTAAVICQVKALACTWRTHSTVPTLCRSRWGSSFNRSPISGAGRSRSRRRCQYSCASAILLTTATVPSRPRRRNTCHRPAGGFVLGNVCRRRGSSSRCLRRPG